MNTFFANIGEQLANDIHGTTSPITGTISPIMTKNIADISLSFKEVNTKLDKLKSNKSLRIDNIPSRLTKLAQPALIQPLYDLFKYSMETTYFST